VLTARLAVGDRCRAVVARHALAQHVDVEVDRAVAVVGKAQPLVVSLARAAVGAGVATRAGVAEGARPADGTLFAVRARPVVHARLAVGRLRLRVWGKALWNSNGRTLHNLISACQYKPGASSYLPKAPITPQNAQTMGTMKLSAHISQFLPMEPGLQVQI
jgi:hypothetical protein